MNDTQVPQVSISQNSLSSIAANWNRYIEVGRSLLKSGFAPTHFKTPEAIVAAILHGQEVGLTPMQALAGIFVINGKPTLDVATMKAIVTSQGVDIQIIESTNEKAHLKLVRGAVFEECVYTIDDAKKSGLTGKEVWNKYPKAMCYARAASILIRNKCSDLIKGLYSREEMLDSIDITPQVTQTDPESTDLGSYRLETKFSLQGFSLSECFCDESKWKTLSDVVADETKFNRLSMRDQAAIYKFAPNLLDIIEDKGITNE